jgi:ketosteroid isomerase-like protein
MSQANVDLVLSCCAAFDRGDYEAALEFFAPDVEYDLSHFPDGGIYRAREGIREAFRIWMGTWEDYRQERDEPVDAGDQVILPTREYGRGKGSGVALERPTFGVWTMRNDKAVRVRFYATMADALEAVGLSA